MPAAVGSVYIGLGSNLGDRARNLSLAISGMRDAGLEITRLSQVYETDPVETFPQPAFLNMVAELDADSLPPPAALMSKLLEIERALGRTRDTAKGPRTIDLDLLLYGDETCDTDVLTLPHPRLHVRRFVLVPLAELSPQLKHPILQKTMHELLAETSDRAEVNRWIPALPEG